MTSSTINAAPQGVDEHHGQIPEQPNKWVENVVLALVGLVLVLAMWLFLRMRQYLPTFVPLYYLTITKDLARVESRVKAIYRSWATPCTGKQVYARCHREE